MFFGEKGPEIVLTIVLTERWSNVAPQTDLAEAQLNGADEKSPVRVEPDLMASTAGIPMYQFGNVASIYRLRPNGHHAVQIHDDRSMVICSIGAMPDRRQQEINIFVRQHEPGGGRTPTWDLHINARKAKSFFNLQMQAPRIGLNLDPVVACGWILATLRLGLATVVES